MKQKVKCADCRNEREIRRKNATAPDYSFWCSECKKEVAQDKKFRKLQDNLKE